MACARPQRQDPDCQSFFEVGFFEAVERRARTWKKSLEGNYTDQNAMCNGPHPRLHPRPSLECYTTLNRDSPLRAVTYLPSALLIPLLPFSLSPLPRHALGRY